MYNISYHKWKLNFFRKEDEQLYEISQLDSKIKVFRIMCFGFGLSFLFLSLSVYLQNGMNSVSIASGLVFVISFIIFILSLKLQFYINWLFCILFIINMSVIAYFAQNAECIPTIQSSRQQYMMGHNQCYIACVILYYTEYKKRFFLLISLVFAQLGYLQLFTDIVGVGMSLFSCIMMTFFCYIFEYQSRQNFDLTQKQRQTKELLLSCTNDHLFITTFNEQNQGFELEFANQQSNNKLNIIDNESLKKFLRECFIVQKDCNNDRLVTFQQQDAKCLIHKITLEEQLFQFVTNQEEINQEINISYDIGQNNLKYLKMSIKSYHLDKYIFVLMSKQNDIQDIINKHENQISTMKQMILNQQKEIVNTSLKLLNQIQKLTNLQVDNQINLINYLSLSVINLVKNSYLFYEVDKAYRSQQQFIQNIEFNSLFNQLFLQFEAAAQSKAINFQLINELNKLQFIKLNPEYLTQILVNLFQYTLNLTNTKNNLILKIKMLNEISLTKFSQKNLNGKPNQQIFQKTQMNIIKFSFQFNTNVAQLLEPQLYRLSECKLNTINKFNYNYFITTVLLDILGPTNIIKNKSQLDIVSNLFSNKITFYIYTDQSRIDPSFYKFNKDNLFVTLFGN